MAKPTRKQPDRRSPASGKGKAGSTAGKRKAQAKAGSGSKSGGGILVRIAAGTMRLALRNPAVFGGTAAFAVIFGFVAANALWYQPGQHPSPLLRTRLPLGHPNAARVSLQEEQALPDPRRVTTFVIEREGDEPRPAESEPQLARTEAELPERPPTPERTASVLPHAAPSSAASNDAPALPAAADAESLVRDVQAELVRRKLYDGAADGRPGPKTTAAVRAFEASAGLPQTGMIGPDLLARLRDGHGAKSAAPKSATRAPGETGDAIAAAIRAAETPTPEGAPGATESAAATDSGPGLVMTIQRGLTNLAYADVAIDGVAGDQTRAAIRHFEKHYRLPETGEPSVAVLRKMQDIGAI
jgi:peptidoglycan hydrolase-like protein with peptidoglycan-binding domain